MRPRPATIRRERVFALRRGSCSEGLRCGVRWEGARGEEVGRCCGGPCRPFPSCCTGQRLPPATFGRNVHLASAFGRPCAYHDNLFHRRSRVADWICLWRLDTGRNTFLATDTRCCSIERVWAHHGPTVVSSTPIWHTEASLEAPRAQVHKQPVSAAATVHDRRTSAQEAVHIILIPTESAARSCTSKEDLESVARSLQYALDRSIRSLRVQSSLIGLL